MIKPKSSLVHIRIEPELLERYQSFANVHGMTLSAALRHHMNAICSQYEASQLAKRHFEAKRDAQRAA